GRVGQPPLLEVSEDPHHPILVVVHRYLLANRIPFWPKPIRQGTVEHQHRSGLGAGAGTESLACENGNTKQPEISRSDELHRRAQALGPIAARRLLAGDVESPDFGQAGYWQPAGQG